MLPIVHLGPLEIPTYFLVLSLICTAGVFIIPAWVRRFHRSDSMASEIYLLLLLVGFFGARLFHVIFEEWDYYSQNPIEVFYLWNGGFVFLGSVVVSSLVIQWYLKQKGERFLLWGDLFSPWLAFGYGMGRLGCFLNGCCYGKVCHLPWAIQFPAHKDVIDPWVPRHPTQLYAFFLEMILFLILLFWMNWKREKIQRAEYVPGQFFLIWLGFHGVFRLIIEQFRDDFRGVEILSLSLSSFISLLLIGIGFWGLMFLKFPSKKI